MKYQVFFSVENMISTTVEDIISFTCEDITVGIVTANDMSDNFQFTEQTAFHELASKLNQRQCLFS